jgi:hypothetical protein
MRGCRHRRKNPTSKQGSVFRVFSFYFPRYRPPFGECVCVPLSLFRFEIRVVCVCGNLCTCVHVSTNLESPPTMGNFKV